MTTADARAELKGLIYKMAELGLIEIVYKEVKGVRVECVKLIRNEKARAQGNIMMRCRA